MKDDLTLMPSQLFDYRRQGDEIYRESFRIIREEANLEGFSDAEARVAVRMIHACGMPEITRHIVFSQQFVSVAASALAEGAPILCDSMMVADGITRSRLPKANPVLCTLRDARTPSIAGAIGNTRSAAAVDLWRDHVDGALIVVGNAPTALYRLMEHIHAGRYKPAAIIGMPVGFVGAAESKALLALGASGPYAIVQGRLGGSALAAACVNALASCQET